MQPVLRHGDLSKRHDLHVEQNAAMSVQSTSGLSASHYLNRSPRADGQALRWAAVLRAAPSWGRAVPAQLLATGHTAAGNCGCGGMWQDWLLGRQWPGNPDKVILID